MEAPAPQRKTVRNHRQPGRNHGARTAAMPADRSDIRHSTVSRWSASLGLLAYSPQGASEEL